MKNLIIVICLGLLLGCSEDEIEVSITAPVTETKFIVPDNYPNISSAILAAGDLDTILLRDGIYSGAGNRDIILKDKSIILISENGADKTIINCAGDSANHHFGFQLTSLATSNSIFEGITIRNAYSNTGSGIHLTTSSPIIKNCIFKDNVALISGGAIRCKNARPKITNCTFVNNYSMSGSSLFLIASSNAEIGNCIFANSIEGEAIGASDATSVPSIVCTNIYNNLGGDWIEKIDIFANINGNFNLDPLFCSDSVTLQEASPCLPANNSCNNLIGALSIGCQTTIVN